MIPIKNITIVQHNTFLLSSQLSTNMGSKFKVCPDQKDKQTNTVCKQNHNYNKSKLIEGIMLTP